MTSDIMTWPEPSVFLEHSRRPLSLVYHATLRPLPMLSSHLLRYE